MEQNSMFFQKDGKNFLQLDCENAKEPSLKVGWQDLFICKRRRKMDPGTSVFHSCELCTDLCGRTGGSASWVPIGHGYGRLYNYIELPDEEKLAEIRDIPHGTLTHEFYKSEISNNWERFIVYLPPCVPSAGLPVLYLQHGFGESEISWTTTGKQMDMNHMLRRLVHFSRKAIIFQHWWRHRILLWRKGSEKWDCHRIIRWKNKKYWSIKREPASSN